MLRKLGVVRSTLLRVEFRSDGLYFGVLPIAKIIR